MGGWETKIKEEKLTHTHIHTHTHTHTHTYTHTHTQYSKELRVRPAGGRAT